MMLSQQRFRSTCQIPATPQWRVGASSRRIAYHASLISLHRYLHLPYQTSRYSVLPHASMQDARGAAIEGQYDTRTAIMHTNGRI
jgi:hypothetical protein